MKGLLLDTHVRIWSQQTPEELGAKATKALIDPGHALYIATLSTLEMARLVERGQIEIEGELSDWIAQSIEALGANTIELSHEAAMEACRLPGEFHPHPADRMLAATARLRDLKLVTADRRILDYPHVKTLSARE